MPSAATTARAKANTRNVRRVPANGIRSSAAANVPTSEPAVEIATTRVAFVFAQTMVEAPKYGARSRAAAISLPRLAAPTTKTTTASGGCATRRGEVSSGVTVGVEVEREGVDAPALPGRARAVVEHMA